MPSCGAAALHLPILLLLAAPSFQLGQHAFVATDQPQAIWSHAVAHNLGPYSPWYSIAKDGPYGVPEGCAVQVVNQLQRHGARWPTSGALTRTNASVAKAQAGLAASTGSDNLRASRLAFLSNFSLDGYGTGDMVPFGEKESLSSGQAFFQRYSHLGVPFVRASGSPRVIASSSYFLQGFIGGAFVPKNSSDSQALPLPDIIIPEDNRTNNTLDVNTCDAFNERGSTFRQSLAADNPSFDGISAIDRTSNSTEADLAVAQYAEKAMAGILKRWAKTLGNDTGLDWMDVMNLFGLCSFDTLKGVAIEDDTSLIKASPVCGMFDQDEFQLFEEAMSLAKAYGYGTHSPFHSALSIGYLRELVARLKSTAPVLTPPTSLNTTLDSFPQTFPLPSARKSFVDFSHDNQIAPIVAGLGLFGGSNGSVGRKRGESAWVTSRIVPFAGRLVVEKLQCSTPAINRASPNDFYVRVLVNDAVQPLDDLWCPFRSELHTGSPFALAAPHLGLCPLNVFLAGLDWTRDGSAWNSCYA